MTFQRVVMGYGVCYNRAESPKPPGALLATASGPWLGSTIMPDEIKLDGMHERHRALTQPIAGGFFPSRSNARRNLSAHCTSALIAASHGCCECRCQRQL